MADDNSYIQHKLAVNNEKKLQKSAEQLIYPPPEAFPGTQPPQPKKEKKRRKKKKQAKRASERTKSSKNKSAEEEVEPEGESLPTCSLKEWEHADAAYNPSLINLKRKQNKVTVFAKTKKVTKDAKATKPGNIKDGLLSVEPETWKALQPTQFKHEDHADKIGKLVAGIVRKFMEGKNEDEVQLEIKLVTGESHTPVLP